MPTRTYPKTAETFARYRYKGRSLGSQPWDNTFVLKSKISWNDSFAGIDNPYWRVQIKWATNAATSCSAYRQFLQNPDRGRFEIEYADSTQEFTQFLEGNRVQGIQGFTGNGIDIDAALNEAKRHLINRVKQMITPLQGGVVLGELGKTLHMIRSPAQAIQKQIRDYFGKLKKVSPRLTKRQRMQVLTDTYLEATFGWTPLFYDAQGAFEALKRQVEGPRGPPIERVSAKGYSEGSSPSNTFPHTPNGTNLVMKMIVTDVEKRYASVWITAGIRMKPSGTSASLPESLGLYPQSWLPSAWELLPYSFLIDYFANIGNIIDAYSTVNPNLAWACMTQRKTFKVTRTIKPDYPHIRTFGAKVKAVVWTPSKPSVLQKIEYSRSPLTTIMPDLAFRFPGLGSKQSYNIAALLFSNGVRRPF